MRVSREYLIEPTTKEIADTISEIESAQLLKPMLEKIVKVYDDFSKTHCKYFSKYPQPKGWGFTAVALKR